MRIWVQKSASMQKRTSPLKFGDLAEKSGLSSVSNLSTKVYSTCSELASEGEAVVACASSTARLSWKIRYRIEPRFFSQITKL